jgi:hypothetical protein
MNRIVNLPEQERIALFKETAGMKKMTPAVVEKDFWVCWTLARLFSSERPASKIPFTARLFSSSGLIQKRS